MAHLLTDQLRIMARGHGDAVAFRDLDAGTAITFARWEEDSNRLARGLVAAGVAPDDRVALYLPMDEVLRWVVAYAAVHKAGGVAVPTNVRLSPRELATIWGHAEISAMVAVVPPEVDVPTLRTVLTLDQWDASLVGGGEEFQVPRDPDDLADILYTSGTTGVPKGVAIRHANGATVPTGDPQWSGQGWLFSSPLFTFAGMSCVYNPMKLGMTAMFQPRFDAGRWLDAVERQRPGAAFLVPAMAQLLIAHPRFEGADLSSLWLCSVGSAPVAPETLRHLQERMPNANVSNGYGMTEAGAAYCVLPREEAQRRRGSVGRVMPPAEVSVVRADGAPAPVDEVGEVLLKPPGRLREYYRDPEATAATYAGGWVHTGDLGRLDADGYLYIVGRAKDVIIRGGNNIYPADIENVLFEHPAVQEAAVAGVAHPVLGEDIAAFVVLRDGARTTPEELRSFCALHLADYKVPRHITVLDSLPRNATGKVVKAQLGTEDAWRSRS